MRKTLWTSCIILEQELSKDISRKKTNKKDSLWNTKWNNYWFGGSKNQKGSEPNWCLSNRGGKMKGKRRRSFQQMKMNGISNEQVEVCIM